MLDFRFLTEEQVFGKKGLNIFKKSPEIIKAPVTDYSLLLGGLSTQKRIEFVVDKKRYFVGSWWTKTIHNFSPFDLGARFINLDSMRSDWNPITYRGCGARPVIQYTHIENFVKSKKVRTDGILEVEFGEYPQFVVEDDALASELERLWDEGYVLPELKFTDKAYSFDSTNHADREIQFYLEQYLEVEYKGNKYVRFTVGENGEGKLLSNNERYNFNDACWLKVEPVKWLVDEREDIAISKNILFAGIQYCFDKKNAYDFGNTDIKQYMDTYFCKEILPSNVKTQKVTVSKENMQESIYNPYNFDFSDVSVKEISMEILKHSTILNIHPALYMYLAYCVYDGEDVFSAKSGETVNLNRFVSSSELLCKTNKPRMLTTIMGSEFTEKFIEFVMSSIVNLDDVLSGNYKEEDLKKCDLRTVFNTIGRLTEVSEEQIGAARIFVKNFGEEICDLFDVLWVKGDNERKRIIDELKQSEIQEIKLSERTK